MMPKFTKGALSISVVALLVTMLIPWAAFAGSVGQIKGTILDKQTGEPVIGASVAIVGTKFGGLCDVDGKFQILRLEPGTYTVRITCLDYASVEVTQVEVKADLTTEVNQKLSKQATALDKTITVQGTKDIIDKFQVASQVSISQESIKNRPVQTVDNLLQQVAGVQTTSSGEVFVRGGRAGEVGYIVDGVPIGDQLSGVGRSGANLSLVSGSIQEIQIIKDGFDPEYGNALSGIVNIRSQTGSKDNTRINLQYITDDLGTKDLNKYSRNYDYVRFSVSGPDPLLKSRILPALGLNFLKDKEFTYFLYAEVEKDDGIYQLNDYDSPATRRQWGKFNLFGLDIPERLNNRYFWNLNVKFRPQQNLKFIASYKRSLSHDILWDWQYRYSSSNLPVGRDEWQSLSFEVTHAVTKDFNYEAVFSYYTKEYTQKPGDPNNPGEGLDPDQINVESQNESYQDVNLNGKYDAPEPIINLYPDSAIYGTDYTGPKYTLGETNYRSNQQGGGPSTLDDFRFNNNGYRDSLEGEAFVDLNGNGVWDAGDVLYDKNGNGQLDSDRLPNVNVRATEPYIDGDSILGEPFADVNGNGVFDRGIDGFVIGVGPDNQDLNHNGMYDGPNQAWTPAVPFIDRNANGIYDAPNNKYDVGEPYTDVNGNGSHDQGGSSTFLSPGSYDEDMRWHRHSTKTLRGEIKAYRNIGPHELKGGFALAHDDFKYEDIRRPYIQYIGRPDGGVYPDRGAFRDFFDYSPWNGTVYFRDKLEYGSMIASLGIRWDFFLQDTKKLADVLDRDDLGGTIMGDRQKFSPRIGFSYPISDKAKVYFNYGHFFQQPSLTYMYARNTTSVLTNDVIGNPNLDYQKTIQYSFGVKYAMSENYSVDIQGYFKDEFDKINSARILDSGTHVFVQKYINSDYGRSRGFELTVEKRGGGYVNGQMSYTYAFAYGKASQATEAFRDPVALAKEPLSESPLNNDIRHSLKAAVNVYIPNTVRPRLFGLPIINGWSLTLESVIESGKPFTPDRSYPSLSQTGLVSIESNSLRYPGTAVFDVRFSKELNVVGIDYNLIFWIENLFDARNVDAVYANTGRPDTRQNQTGVVKAGTPYDENPYNWGYGRQVRVGIEMSL